MVLNQRSKLLLAIVRFQQHRIDSGILKHMTKEIMTRTSITDSPLTQPFVIKAGDVVHLGGYDVSQTMGADVDTTTTTSHWIMLTTDMKIAPRPFSQAEVQRVFAVAYPNFASQPFRCILCADTIEMPKPNN